jgi:dTDP-4-dehydrorhamnose reductase
MTDSSPRFLIIGSEGQLGSALLARLGAAAKGLARADLDLALAASAPARIEAVLGDGSWAAVINAAAYNSVDGAEAEPELARRVNELFPGTLARACALRGIPLVHFSSDYVFSGEGDAPWRESDVPRPLNAYGRSKLAGEEAVRRAEGPHLIFRTSWLHSETRSCFVRAILGQAAELEELRVVDDQWGSPTYAGLLAESTITALKQALADQDFVSGLYHLCDTGFVSRHGFAEHILQQALRNGLRLRARAVTAVSSPAGQAARRPLNCRLDTREFRARFGRELPGWRQGVELCVRGFRA